MTNCLLGVLPYGVVLVVLLVWGVWFNRVIEKPITREDILNNDVDCGW